MNARNFIAGLILASVPSLAFSQGGDSSSEPPLSLRSAIEKALEQNLGLRIQTLAPDIAEEAVIAQEASFDPSVFSRANLSQSDLDWEDSNGATRQTTSDSRSYSLGVTKRIKTGAQVTASASQSRSDGSSFNSELGQLVGGSLSERASLSLEFTQPLLRDFGSEVNLAPVRRAKSQARVADLRTRNAVLNLLQQIENAYWQLSDAHQRRNLRQSNLELSERLLEEARERERLGLATRIETLQAEANLAQRKEQIIRAEQAIREATDALYAAMGVLDETMALDPQLSVYPLPESRGEPPSFQTTLDTAIERNFDADIQEEVLEQLEQDRILARNSERPQVDLSLSSSYNGLSPESGKDAFSEAFDRRGDDWGLRLSFNLPWGARAAKSNLRQTLYRIDQEELRLAEIKQDLLRSVRSAWRDLDASRQQLAAAKIVVQLQEATYEQETSKYEEGLSTIRTLLETQRDLDQAKLSLLDAQLATVQAEITLARVEGSLLDRHGIEWNDTLTSEE
ncbi:TolC family protein [Pelagicoccus sp. NFK12]|uniref:TolC family protein n=1 Tax=Pelagicoccus enzymogenes TaxID=2773457 RepID=A0A927F6L7_9BACT|nr:TolC family protein [Pelagicoccus enzymogenes]MBD5779182.1 TolC family protein [Pelagicoccus enzymogenes]